MKLRSSRETTVVLTPERFAAVIFDLDGVVTDTARAHAAAWKEMFDALLSREHGSGSPLPRPFDDFDYRNYVDGRPRYDGVVSFLGSRGIELPRGSPSDDPDQVTVCGLGNRKDELFRQRIRTHGVAVYPGAVETIRQLRAVGIRTAVVTASKNCQEVLEAAGIAGIFEVTVDGHDQAVLGLPGKPAPDTFLEAARRLATPPARAVVFEDALVGVQAGKAGGFGMVVGVDRTGNPHLLLAAGADIVISDFAEVVVVVVS
ncbi:MAG: beta-phosphoglucomutase family hydrolase [Pseudomonadota bacterium]